MECGFHEKAWSVEYMAIEFEDGNPNANGSSNFMTTMFMGFVAQLEQQNPELVRSVLSMTSQKAEEFSKNHSLELSDAAKKELIGAFNSFFFGGMWRCISRGGVST